MTNYLWQCPTCGGAEITQTNPVEYYTPYQLSNGRFTQLHNSGPSLCWTCLDNGEGNFAMRLLRVDQTA